MFAGGSTQTSVPTSLSDLACARGYYGEISDSQFLNGIQDLLNSGKLILIDYASSMYDPTKPIPSWIINNAGWWCTNQITYADFESGLLYLIQDGYLQTSSGGFDEEACPDCNWTEPDTGTVQPVKEEKTTICHFPPGNVDNPQTLTISENAWKAHDKHGDVFGNCPDKSEDKQFLASAEPVSPKVTPTDTPTQTSQDDDKLSEIIEENKKLREELERQGGEIKELNKQVDYLGEIIASIQRIFSGWFS